MVSSTGSESVQRFSSPDQDASHDQLLTNATTAASVSHSETENSERQSPSRSRSRLPISLAFCLALFFTPLFSPSLKKNKINKTGSSRMPQVAEDKKINNKNKKIRTE